MNYEYDQLNNGMPTPPMSRMDQDELDNDIQFTDQNPEFVEFKIKVKEWLALDDDIRTLRQAIRERDKKKKELTPLILEFMNQNKISDLNTENGKLQYRSSLYKKPLNQKTIQNRLASFFKDIKKGETVANYLLENRERVERVSLRRRIDKKKQISL